MATPGRGRSALASIIGYVIVAIIVWWLLKFLIGTLFWIVRTFIALFVFIALVVIYFKLKSPKRTT